MKLLCLYGSPLRKGNSAAIADAFLDRALELGTLIETEHMTSLRYSGCRACMKCKTGYQGCVLKDDLTAVIDKVLCTDLLVLAGPIYHGDFNAAVKAFIERSHSLLGPPQGPLPGKSLLGKGKKILFIITQGYDEDKQNDLYPRYKKVFELCGFAESHLLRSCNVVWPGEVKTKTPETLESARKLADKLCIDTSDGSH